jgi:hypothetical protein
MASTAVRTSTIVNFNFVPLMAASIITRIISIEPCTISKSAPRIEAMAGTTTAYLVAAKMRFIAKW